MCYGCYIEYGSPTEVTPRTAAVTKLIAGVYEIHAAGGTAHIVVDDWNLGDENIDWCLELPDIDDVCRRCLEAMRQLTETERAIALGAHDGFIDPPSQSTDG